MKLVVGLIYNIVNSVFEMIRKLVDFPFSVKGLMGWVGLVLSLSADLFDMLLPILVHLRQSVPFERPHFGLDQCYNDYVFMNMFV